MIRKKKMTIISGEPPSYDIPIQLGTPFIWLDASDSSSLEFYSSNYVNNWLDKSGNNNNAFTLETNTGIIPSVVTDEQNGLSTISFNGDYLQTDNFGLKNQPCTYILMRKLVNVADGTLFDGIDATDYNKASVLSFKDTINAGGLNVQIPYAGADSLSYQIMLYVFNGVNSKIRRFTGVESIGNAGGLGVKGITFGANSSLLSNKTAYIGDFLMYDNLLTDAQINTACNYLATKWGLTWTDI